MQVGGKLFNYTGRFFVTMTTERTELYNIMQQRHLANMNRPQMFTANNYKIDSERVSDDLGRGERAKVFAKYTKEANIQDIKLFPSNDMEDVYLRVARTS